MTIQWLENNYNETKAAALEVVLSLADLGDSIADARDDHDKRGFYSWLRECVAIPSSTVSRCVALSERREHLADVREVLAEEVVDASARQCLNVLEKGRLKERRQYLYAVTNPAWPGWTKIGISDDVNKRLSSYQTGSPFRDYAVAWSVPVGDRKSAQQIETYLHHNRDWDGSYEWIQATPEEVFRVFSLVFPLN